MAAFPLAPLFALLNNWVEIRLDAHKFTTVLRRPIAERAQDIGAWFYILTVISQLAVVTNAFLIAVTAQLVPVEVYAHSFRYIYSTVYTSPGHSSLRKGYVTLNTCYSWVQGFILQIFSM